MNLNDTWIEIFRAGKYPQRKKAYTEKELQAIVDSYDPKYHEAPIILDHNSRGPAYGWVESIRKVGDVIKAKLKQVPAELNEWVNSGRYKKRSAELYDDLDGKGPYLRALSFLNIPQVKGLQPAFKEFKDDRGEFNSYEFEDEQNKSIPQGGNDMEKKEIQAMLDEQAEKLGKKFGDEVTGLKTEFDEKLEAKDKEIKKLEEARKGDLAKFNEAQEALIRNDIAAFCDKLKADGKLPPAFDRMGGQELMFKLAEVPGVVKYAETDKDDKTTAVEKSPLKLFKDILAAFAEIMPKGQTKTGGKDETPEADTSEFSDEMIDERSVKINALAEELMAKAAKENKTLEFGEAMVQADDQLRKKGE